MKNNQRAQWILLTCTLLSGFSFLIYEVSWFRMLSLMIGATVQASTIVLTSFMAGFGLGAWFFGRHPMTRRRPARLLSFLLLGVALIGFLSFPLIRQGIPLLYTSLGVAGITLDNAASLVMLFCLVGLFLPALLMGGLLPVMAVLLIRDNRELTVMTGRLYALETLGSVLGALSTAFLLIRFLGQQETLWLAVGINAVCAVLIARSGSPLPEEPDPEEKTGKERVQVRSGHMKIIRSTALICAFSFGLAVAGLQIAWFRIFKVYLTNTSYSFALITAMVILGFFAGGHLYSRSSGSGSIEQLSRLLALAAVIVIAGFVILVWMPQWIMFPLAGNHDAFMMRIFVIPVLTALLVILPLTLVSGYCFPFACTAFAGGYRQIGSGMASIYAASTAGAVIGPSLTAFLLIPGKGAALAVLFYAFFLIVAALATIRRLEWTLICAAMLLLVYGFLPVVRILPPSFVRYERELLQYRETVEGTWMVARGTGGRDVAVSTYVNNSAVIGSTYDAVKAVKLVGHLPFYAGLKCRNVLVIGFGIGVTTSAIASHPEVERIDCIELVAGLKDAAPYYSALNAGVDKDPRVQIKSGDGRHFLQATARRYDLISCDPTHPVLGSGSLYTRDYFQLCRQRLTEEGMVSQYLPLHKLRRDDFLGIIKTFHEVFPGATVWLGHSHAVLLGSVKPLAVDFSDWVKRVEATARDPFFYSNPYHLAASFIWSSAAIAAFPAEVPTNSDDYPLTEFFRISALDPGNIAINLGYMNEHRSSPGDFFHGISNPDLLERFLEGNRMLTRAILQDMAGNRQGFFELLQNACQINPENEELPFLIKYFQ